MKSDLGDRFGDIVNGLLSLEINTVIRPQMLAIRMPTPITALCQIATEYQGWLQEHRAAIDPLPDVIDKAYLGKLVAAAKALRTAGGLNSADFVLASRIVDNGGYLVGLYDKVTSTTVRPDPDEMVQFRKIWEIGLESIALQTIIWIDGDVTQRIRADLLASDQKELFALHRVAVDTSISVWKELSSIITSIFTVIWEKLT